MIAENIRQVQEIVSEACARVSRDPTSVKIVAVSKRKPLSDIEAAIEAGLQHFGENRVEEAETKIPSVDANVTWHMIGHIQSRKAKKVPPLFQIVHSVDSLKLAQRLSRLVADDDLQVLLQVNVSGEESKGGFEASGWQHDQKQKETLFQQVQQVVELPGLQVAGLMTMAPIVEDKEATRPLFASLAALRQTLMEDLQIDLPELSMGMTDDYPVAIEEGATMIRIGRAIFGERTY